MSLRSPVTTVAMSVANSAKTIVDIIVIEDVYRRTSIMVGVVVVTMTVIGMVAIARMINM